MHTFCYSRQATRPDAARPHGQALSAYFFVFVVRLFFALSFPFLLFIYRCILFSAFLLAFFFCICRPRSGRLRRRKNPETRINSGFARVCIFLKIFLIFKKFFILFFILCIFLHIIYVQENVRRIRRRTLFPLYFLYSVVETAAALQALCPGLWLSLFLWRKKKKKKKRK